MGVVAGNFRIRNKHSGLYMTVVDFSEKVSARIMQYASMEANDPNRDSQIWHVFPLLQKYYFLLNLKSGWYLNVYENGKDAGDPLEQFSRQQDVPKAAQIWDIVDDSASGMGCYAIHNVVSNFYANVAGHSTDVSAVIEQNILESEFPGRDSQVWIFEPESRPWSEVLAGEIIGGDDKVSTDFYEDVGQDRPPSVTKEILVGQVAMTNLKFDGLDSSDANNLLNLKIADETCGASTLQILQRIKDEEAAADRSQGTANCILFRYGYWNAVYYHEHPTSVEATCELEIKVGMIKGDPDEVKKVAGISVNKDGSFVLGGAVLSVFGDELSRGLQIAVGRPNTGDGNVKMTLSYDSLISVAVTVWFREDHYVLRKSDGGKVLEWFTRDPTLYRTERRRLEPNLHNED